MKDWMKVLVHLGEVALAADDGEPVHHVAEEAGRRREGAEPRRA